MKNVKPGHIRPRILIDPGHRGFEYNGGAVAGYYESERMWKLTMYEKEALEAYGIEVILSRSGINDNPDVVTRGKMAADCDLAYSNHTNAGGKGKADYPMAIIFVDDNCSVIDEQSKEFGRLMAGVCADVVGTKDPARIWTRASDYDRDGNGYNDDWYGFLRGAHEVGTPAIIMEHIFHDHPASAAWMMDDNNLKKLAQAKAAAIAKWFDVEKPITTTAPISRENVILIELETLREGDTGPGVKFLQRFLKGYSPRTAAIINAADGADSIFGKATGDALEIFQAENKDADGKPLTKDRIAGPKTWDAITGQAK